MNLLNDRTLQIPNRDRRGRCWLIFGVTLLLSLGACTQVEEKRSLDSAISDAVLNQAGGAEQDALSPEYYINLASQASGEVRQQYLIRAAELLIQRGDIELAKTQLQNLDADSLALTRQQDIQILAARIALKNGNPIEAMQLLPEETLLSESQQISATQVRADANFQLGYLLKAAQLRIGIDPRIATEAAREDNHQGIWRALTSLPESALAETEVSDATTRAWIELARIFSNAQHSLGRLQQEVLDWGTTHADHPVSNRFINDIIDLHLANRRNASSVAVLLPMSGRLAGVADAIRGGLLSAHYQRPDDDLPVELRFYNTADPDIDFESLYQQALYDGASAIIGPLEKTSINKLAQFQELDVPVLTLNYAENAFTTTENLFQFGLLPEDEAEQAAELAIKDGHQRAVVLVAESEWGARMQTAFATRFRQLGGEVVSVQRYDPQKDDYRAPIQALFGIDRSNRRHKDLEFILGKKLQFQPHRREDVDMIFLAASSRSARGIMPAFKFHHAGTLPVYATSSVFTGNIDRSADRDLNGILFCDLPWTITSDNALRRSFEEQWPEYSKLTRLFAMGADAYHLVRNLTYLGNNAYARFPGETGNLYMDEYGRFHRDLVWAKFRGGLPQYVDTFTAPPIDTGELIEDEQARPADRTGV